MKIVLAKDIPEESEIKEFKWYQVRADEMGRGK